jgi:cation diffusion facilitator family transporter
MIGIRVHANGRSTPMANCCEDKSCEIASMREAHGTVLWIVLAINALMFVVEGWAGVVAHSTSLLADALDMLGDALVYGFSLFVLSRPLRWQAGAALMKGVFMLAFGVAVLAEAIHKVFVPVMPGAGMMGVIGGLALAANVVCFALLYRHRGDNLNMSSTWLCSRNDLIANAGVLIAAGATYLSTSRWPDIVVGCIIAILFLRSAYSVIAESGNALRKSSLPVEGAIGEPGAETSPAAIAGARIHFVARRGTGPSSRVQ